MNESDYTPYRYSMQGLGRAWCYYEPAMLRFSMWSALVVVLCFLLALAGTRLHSMQACSTAFTILSFPVYLSSIAFAIYRDRTPAIQLPLLASEKITVMAGFSFIIFPLAMLMLWMSLEGIASLFISGPSVYQSFIDMALAKTGEYEQMAFASLQSAWYNRIGNDLLPTAVCLYVVIATRSQRIMKGVAAIVLTLVAIGIVSAIFTLFGVFHYMSDLEAGNFNEQAFAVWIIEEVKYMMKVFFIVSPCLTALIIYMSWRKLKSVQI